MGETGGFEVLLHRGLVWEDCTISQFGKERDSIDELTLEVVHGCVFPVRQGLRAGKGAEMT